MANRSSKLTWQEINNRGRTEHDLSADPLHGAEFDRTGIGREVEVEHDDLLESL